MVTAALSRILGEALAGVPAGGVQNAHVTTLRPDMLGAPGTQGVNVFLYQITANGDWAGAALPTRRSDGTVVRRPEHAVNLHYLLTFSGDESALEPQRMLGAAVTALAAQPVLSRTRVRDLILRAIADDPATWQQFSDLADQIDVVRFTPLSLSLEELSKLWSTFIQAPYRLSVTYQASVVLLDADISPQPALPVLSRGIDAAALSIPSITRVVADSGPSDPLVPGAVMRIEGERLRGTAVTRVRLDDVDIPVPADGITGTALRAVLPATVPAGVRSLQVVHPRLIGTPPVERSGAESNAQAVLVRPLVIGPVTSAQGAPGGTNISIPVRPAVQRQQRIMVLLNEHNPPPGRPARAYLFTTGLSGDAAPPSLDTVVVPVRGVVPGRYLVRVQVDGAQSLLGIAAGGGYDSPTVVLA